MKNLKKFMVSLVGVAFLVGFVPAKSIANSSFISFGGNIVSAPITTPATNGVSSVENPDKIQAGDPTGISVSAFGNDIDPDATVNQIVTTQTK
ncbi:MAG: hypothetical protein LBR30_05365 [Clostridioides sp.]|jgi:hypothetical protein|nr:hypothetical protein [Clostridioides sp.]